MTSLLIVSYSAQRLYSCQFSPWTDQRPRMRAMSKQEFMVCDLLAALELHTVLTCLYTCNLTRNKTNVVVLIKGRGTRPELFFRDAFSQIIFQGWPIVDRKGFFSDESKRAACIVSTQQFGGSHSSDTIANNHIRHLLIHTYPFSVENRRI